MKKRHPRWKICSRAVSACVPVLFTLFGRPAAADETPNPLAKAEQAYRRGDLAEAIRLYRGAAETGDGAAQARLGDILDKAEENEDAVAWYRRSADRGNAHGLYGLGQMLASGEGVARSSSLAMRYWGEASRRGHVVATLVLARTYESGWADVKADPAAALQHWQKAAELGDIAAIHRLAAAYRKGELGVKADESRAAAWEARLPAEPRR